MADKYFPRTQTNVNTKGFLYIVLIFLAILCIQKNTIFFFFEFLNWTLKHETNVIYFCPFGLTPFFLVRFHSRLLYTLLQNTLCNSRIFPRWDPYKFFTSPGYRAAAYTGCRKWYTVINRW